MAVWFVGTVAVLFLLDLLVKESVEKNVSCGEEREFLKKNIILRKVYNKGMMLHTFEQYPRLIKGVTIVAGLFLVLYDAVLLCRKRHYIEKIGMMLFTGGALSNIYDRLLRGKVIDYIGFKTKSESVTKVTFNMGDFFIALGALIVVISGRKR